MTADVTAQAWAVVQAIGLGLAAGLLYDLFRVLRVRVHVPLLGPLLDLLFWITLTAVLFVWSQWAWGGWCGCMERYFCSSEAASIFGCSVPVCSGWATVWQIWSLLC